MTFFYDINKKLQQVLEMPKSEHKQLNEGAQPAVAEGSTGDYSAKKARAGKDIGDLTLGLQVRTAIKDAGGMLNSVEGTVGTKVGALNVFGGIGHDNGFNGGSGKSFQYGLLGLTTGAKVGPGYALVGAKTRVNWDDANPKQTVGFATYMMPVAKNVALNFNVSKSWQTIQENAVGLGLGFSF